MITTLQKKTLALVAAGSNQGLFSVDLANVQNVGDIVSVEAVIQSNGVAPGASTVTVKAAFSSDADALVAELSTCAAELPCAVANVINTKRRFLMPLLWQGARYLHIWCDLDALAGGGAALSAELRINTKR